MNGVLGVPVLELVGLPMHLSRTNIANGKDIFKLQLACGPGSGSLVLCVS